MGETRTPPFTLPEDLELEDAYQFGYFDGVLRAGARDLSPEVLGKALGPRYPSGSMKNRVRGVRIRMLNARGFTCQGKRIK